MLKRNAQAQRKRPKEKRIKSGIKSLDSKTTGQTRAYPILGFLLLASCGGDQEAGPQLGSGVSNLASIGFSGGNLIKGQTTVLTVTFKAPPIGFVPAKSLSVSNGILNVGTFDSTGRVYSATFIPAPNINNGLATASLDNDWADPQGEQLTAVLTSNPIGVDTVPPSATIATSQRVDASAGVTDIEVAFSEVPTNFDVDVDIIVTGGTLSGLSFNNSGLVLTGIFMPDADSNTNVRTIQLGTNWTDAAGNSPVGTLKTYIAGTNANAPTASISVSNPLIISGEKATIIITFSDVPLGFDPSLDLTISHGSIADGAFDGTGKIFTAIFTPDENITTNVFITLNSNWTDSNAVPPNSPVVSNTFSIDTVAPAAVIALSDNELTLGETSVVTITFSETPQFFDYITDITSPNGSLSSGAFDSTGLQFTAVYTPNTNIKNSTNNLTVKTDWSDASGNSPLVEISSENFTIDTVPLTITGNAIKGPLEDAMAFADEDGDGIKGPDEVSFQTDKDGGFTLTASSLNTKVVVKTTENTVDTSSGEKLSGVTLSAPAGSSVISPATTILEAQPNINSDQLAIALGIPTKTASGEPIDLLTFNPFSPDADPDVALAVEKAAQQVMVTIKAVSAAAEGAGMSVEAAFAQAMESVAEVVSDTATTIDVSSAASKEAAEASVASGDFKKIDLSDTAVLNSVTETVKEKVNEAAKADSTLSINQDAFAAVLETAVTAVSNVVAAIEAITDTNLSSSASKGVFATLTNITTELKSAAEAEVKDPGSGAALVTFTDVSAVTNAAETAATVIKEAVKPVVVAPSAPAAVAPPPDPEVTFTSSSADGTYVLDDTLNLTATLTQYVKSGSSMTATLDTGDVITLTANTGGYKLYGVYKVGAGDFSNDLSISSFNGSNLKSPSGITLQSLKQTSLGNLSDTSALVIVSDDTAPLLDNFSSSSNNGTYNFGSTINITATFNEYIKAGSSFTVTLSTSDEIVLTTTTNSTTLTGTYTVGDSDNSSDLTINSFVVGTVTDIAKNALTSTTIPSGKNLADNKAILVVTDAPRVTAFTSTTSDGTYIQDETINITATTNENVTGGSNFNVTLDTGDVVTLTAGSTGKTLVGTYTVGTGDNTSDLNVASYAVGTVTDSDGNRMVTTILPTGSNLLDSSALVVDTTAPNITGSNYASSTGTLTLVGRNFDWIGAANSSTDIKSKIDATKLTWDINADNSTTADKVFSNSDISAAYVIDPAVIRVTLTSDAKADLAATSGFGDGGGVDKLDVTAGLFTNGSVVAATDDASDVTILTDSTAPTISSSTGFTSSTSNGNYGLGAVINITATMSESVVSGSNITVTLGTTDQIKLEAASTGTTLSGEYTVGANDTATDLAISSFVVGSVKDAYDNVMTSTTIPSGKNLSDNAAIVIDTTAPTATVTSVAYHPTAVSSGSDKLGTLTLTGTNLQTLNVASPSSTEHKTYLDWTKFVWDINGDGSTTADKTFAVADIHSVVAPNASTMTITLTAAATTALNGTTGFGAIGNSDTLDVTAGFLKDIFGNAAATDARANGVISYNDAGAPTVASGTGFTSTSADTNYGLGATINITATMSEPVIKDSTFTVTLGTTDEVVLTAAGDPSGTTLTGTYTIGANDNASDLAISSFVAGTVTDVYGNTMTSTSIPSGKNLSDNSAIVIDTTAPTTTITSAAYNPNTGVITLTGTNLQTLNVGTPSSDNHKAYLDWTKFVWDINGDGSTTADKTFALSDINTVTAANASTMAVTLTNTAKGVLNLTGGFGAIGGSDTLDVTAGFIRDIFGNGATTDARANGTISYSDATPPTVASGTGFTSTTKQNAGLSYGNGNYGLGDAINITATMSENVITGSSFTVTLGTSDEVVLTALSTGTTLSGTYTIGTNDSATDLAISSFVVGTVTDVYGNTMTSTTIPSGENLSDNAALAFDTAAPTATITSVVYHPTAVSSGSDKLGTLTLTGTNLQTLNVASPSSTEHKTYLDWTKFVWDINGDGSTTADKTFAVADIHSVVAPNASTMTITLTAAATTALNGTTGFGAIGNSDTLDVTAGFLKDIFGNAAATDARANGVISYNDAGAPTVASGTGFTSSSDDTNYGLGDTINITATMSEDVIAGSSFTVTLGTSDEIVLTAASTGPTLTGNYTTGSNDTASDLAISSFVVGTVTDVYGNTMTSTTIPSGKNLSDNSAIVIDTTAPTTTITSAAYNPNTGVITLTGTNLQTLNVGTPSSDNHKAYLDWTKFVWDINGDGSTTADKTFALSDINTVTAANASTMAVTLTNTAKGVLNLTGGFGAIGGSDTLDVTAGFIKDIFGNAAATDARANGVISYSDTGAPTVASGTGFTSTSADTNYGFGATINITATMSEPVIKDSSFTVTLGTSDEIVLIAAGDPSGTTLTGTYTTGSNDTASDLAISSFVVGTVTDVYGNTMTSTTIPSGKNLSDNAAIVIDTTAPTATVTSVAYHPTAVSSGSDKLGTLTLTGTNLQTLNVASPSSTEHKTYLDWTKFVWDINGDGSTTADKTFAVADIHSVVAPNASTMTITLTAAATTALNGTTGFGAIGNSDTLDVTAGFLKDIFGNAAATDARANGVISYNDAGAPTVASGTGFTSSSDDTNYGLGDTINITATMSEDVIAGSSFTVTLGTTDEIVLSNSTTGTTLTGSYTVSSADASSDLAISSFVVGTVTDVYGNTMTSTSIPSGENLSDNSAIVIDNIPVAKNGNVSVTQKDSGNSSADANDLLVMSFTEAIGNTSTVSALFNTDVYGASGSRATTLWSNGDRTLSVTLGTGESFSVSDAIALNGVEDLAGNASNLTF